MQHVKCYHTHINTTITKPYTKDHAEFGTTRELLLEDAQRGGSARSRDLDWVTSGARQVLTLLDTAPLLAVRTANIVRNSKYNLMDGLYNER